MTASAYASALIVTLLLNGACAFAETKTSAIALAEMQTIAQGIQTCELDTLFFVVPEALNDSGNPSANPIYNYINDQGGTYVVSASEGVFRPARRDLLTGFNQWNGPYVNYQSGRTQTTPTPYDLGSPLDPWNSPYLLFSPLGLLRGDTGTETLEYYGDAFDRYTLVSLGPDGVQSGDDVSYQFGGSVTAFAISSLRQATSSLERGAGPRSGFSLYNGRDAIVRGINLGATQAGGEVIWGTESFPIVSWTSREVAFSIPTNAVGSNSLKVKRGASETNALVLDIAEPLTSVTNDWTLYH